MNKLLIGITMLLSIGYLSGQDAFHMADSLKKEGLLMPALGKYSMEYYKNPTPEVTYRLASTSALLWTEQMRDTAFFFLNQALSKDSSLQVLYDYDFLSIIEDPRWNKIEENQLNKYEAKNGPIDNKTFAKALFKMIIRDQGLMYAGNIERRKYIQNGGYFDSPSIFPILAMEEKNKAINEEQLLEMLDKYGWPQESSVTEYAAAGAALIINHSTYEIRSKYFPMLEKAFKAGEAQPLRYAKMRDRLLVEEGKEQLYGTQIEFKNLKKEPYPIYEENKVDARRAEIGLGPLSPYLKARFGIDWGVEQE